MFRSSFLIYQKTIVLYIHMKGMGLDAIHKDLVCTLGKEAVAYTTVIKYVRNARFAPKTEAVTPEPAEGRNVPVDEAILSALVEYPFFSGRELSSLSCLPRSAVHRHLAQSLRFTVRHSRWVLRILTAEQKRIRVDMAGELLRVLASQATH
jgi:hypothetical protein